MKFKLNLAVIILATLTACDSTPDFADDPEFPSQFTPEGAWILCAGNFDQNNSTLDFFNPKYPDELVTRVFESTNHRALGSNATDMTIHGGKMYITVSTSATLEITDLRGNALKTLTFATETGTPRQPRYVTASGSNVYVSLYDGYVAVIDTVALQITQTIPVGPNPEDLCTFGGKLYVAESGGYVYPSYNNTVGVIDLATNQVVGHIITPTNPNRLATDRLGNLYVHCFGNFADEPNSLTRIRLSDGQSETILTNSQILFATTPDCLYIYSAHQENWVVTEKQILTCPLTFGQTMLTTLLNDNATPADVYSLSANPANGNLYMGMTDYATYGSFSVFTPEGTLVATHPLSGINPQGAWFTTK